MVFPVVGGNLLDTSYEISNSLRMDNGDSPYLEKTFSGSPTSTTKCTISFWTKLADPSDTNAKNIFSAIKSGVNEDCIKFMGVNNGILNNLELVFNNTGDGSMMVSNGTSSFVKFRDVSAWYHIVVAIDSTQGTASNRVKVYVNGTQFDVELRIDGGSQTTDVPLSQNYALGFLTASKHQIGENVDGSGEHYDGYLSEFYFVDGQQYAPTVFGETDDNGVWIPKDAKNDVSFGNYGFYLEFKQTGTSANSSGMGADTSGNDNHFSASGLTAAEITTDTPTNNFCTWNPLFTNQRGTFQYGNTYFTTSVQGSVPYGQTGFGTIAVNKGKWYCEFRINSIGSGGQLAVGWNERAEDGGMTNGSNNLGSGGNVWYGSSGKFQDGSTSNTTSPNSYTTGDIIGFAIDIDNKKFYAHKNGTYQSNGTGTGDPANGTNGFTFNTHYNDYWTPWMSKDDTNHNATVTLNTGAPNFTISSAQSDDNGYGIFEYDVPTGFYSLCTKNLAEYG